MRIESGEISDGVERKKIEQRGAGGGGIEKNRSDDREESASPRISP
jgi:hypothetical protein